MNANRRHYSLVAEFHWHGEIVPSLGASTNLYDRPEKAHFEPGSFAASGRELTQALAERSRFQGPDDPDLVDISRYVDATLGESELHRYLHAVFDSDCPPRSLQHLLAWPAAFLRERVRKQLVLTTNYDDLVERPIATGNLGVRPTRRCSHTQCSAAIRQAAARARPGSGP